MRTNLILLAICLIYTTYTADSLATQSTTYNSLSEKIMARYGSGTTTETPYIAEVRAFQEELNESYADPEKSPLDDALRETFTAIGGHDFFAVDPEYRVLADLQVFDDPKTVTFPTSSEVEKQYLVYGKASFTLKGEPLTLLLYRSKQLMNIEGYKDYLFLPFKDATSGLETYGGGKYLDMKIPEDPTSIVIDFNKSYQPYCAYTTGYSCPIPPQENVLKVRIEAGVKQIDLGE